MTTDGRLNAVAPLTENVDTTKPRVSSPLPALDGSTRDRTSNTAATVTDAETDAETERQQGSIKISLDGNPRSGFSYNGGTDRLACTPPRIAYGRHTVEVVAEEGRRQQRDHLHLGLQGGPLGPENTWSEGTRRAGVEAAALRLRGATRGCGKRSRPGACL